MKKVITKSIGLYLNVLAFVNPRKAGKKGLEIFCFPLRPNLNDKQRQFLDAAKDVTFDYDGATIQTYKWGSGATKILFLHGWQSHTYRWKRYIESFDKDKYTIHALDAPGHGLSGGKQLSVPLYSDVISTYVKHLGPVDSIVGHSIGGFSALYTFYRLKETIAPKLILLAPPGEAAEFFTFYKRSLGLSDRAERIIIDRFHEVFGKRPDYFSAPYFANSLSAKGLIIHDIDDTETSANHSRRIHANWTNSELQLTKGFGHNLKSDLIVNSVFEFVTDGTEKTYNENQLIKQM